MSSIWQRSGARAGRKARPGPPQPRSPHRRGNFASAPGTAAAGVSANSAASCTHHRATGVTRCWCCCTTARRRSSGPASTPGCSSSSTNSALPSWPQTCAAPAVPDTAFAALDDGLLREDAIRDIGSLLVWIGLQPGIDATRVAVMGRGYGGFQALAALAQYGDRLRAAVAIDPPADLLAVADAAAAAGDAAEFGSSSDERQRALLQRMSPLGFAGSILRPVLLAHFDGTVTGRLSDAEQILWRMRVSGRDAAYIAVDPARCGQGLRGRPLGELGGDRRVPAGRPRRPALGPTWPRTGSCGGAPSAAPAAARSSRPPPLRCRHPRAGPRTPS